MIPQVQIRLEKWGATKDVKGNMVEAIETKYNLWAEIVPERGIRIEIAGQTRLANSKKFKIRFRPDWILTGKWKVIYLKKRYTITSIDRVNEKRFNWVINGEG